MKLNFLFCYLFSLSLIPASWSQNLVLNPSFETTSACPQGPSQLPLAANWDDLNTNVGGDSCSSPDLYGTCSWQIGGVNVPSALLGYQFSRTGNHHAGIIVESRPPFISTCPPSGGSVDNYREYLGGQLSAPLIAGQSYCVQMYVNLASKAGWGIDKLGIYFYNSSASIAKDFCANNAPIQIPLSDPKLLMTTGTPITDTVNWVLLNWNYVAQGGENRIAIGNFFDKATQNRAANDCNAQNLQGGTYSYYFIDDVSVTATACCITDVAPVTGVCINDPIFNFNPQTPGGTFSGPGITNASNGTFDPAIAGAGTHTITYALPCGSGSFQIVVNNCASLNICLETNGDLTVSGGTAPYQWQTQTVTQDCSSCISGCVFPPGCAVNVTTWNTYSTNVTATPGTLPIQVLDNVGNSELITTLAGIPLCSISPCPTITVSVSAQQNVTCAGDSNGAATVSATGGNAPYSFVWSPGGMSGSTQNMLSAGMYSVVATDVNGCSGTVSLTITEPSTLVATSNSTPADCGATNGSANVAISGGSAPYSYTWAPAGGNGASATNLSSGTYTVSIVDANGCILQETIQVGSNGGPSLTTIVNNDVSCFGGNNGSATVTISGGNAPFTINWAPSGETTATANLLSAGSNTVTVVDASGCSVSSTIQIIAPTAIVIQSSITDEDCGNQNGAINLQVTGGTGAYSYIWVGTNATSNVATNLTNGNYAVTVTDANGCQANGSFSVNQIGSLAVSITSSSTQITQGESLQLTATSGVNYMWSPTSGLSCTNCQSPIATPSQSTLYQVEVTDVNGCSGIATIYINVIPVCGDIFVPTVFSPNEDLNNDQLCVFANCLTDVQFSVYNRWGERVFTTHDLTVCWDGTHKGKPVNAEVFVFKLIGIKLDGTEVNLSGNIQVIR